MFKIIIHEIENDSAFIEVTTSDYILNSVEYTYDMINQSLTIDDESLLENNDISDHSELIYIYAHDVIKQYQLSDYFKDTFFFK